MKKNVFKSEQKFNDKLVLGTIGIGAVSILVVFFKSILMGQVTLESFFVFLVLFSVLGGAFVWLRAMSLNLVIDDEKIEYKMHPFNIDSKTILWKDVATCNVVRTPKYAQWHGSNLSFGTTTWLSLSGKNGLSIKTKNGKSFFIGATNLKALSGHLSKAKLSQLF